MLGPAVGIYIYIIRPYSIELLAASLPPDAADRVMSCRTRILHSHNSLITWRSYDLTRYHHAVFRHYKASLIVRG